jgi:hypothetical protein
MKNKFLVVFLLIYLSGGVFAQEIKLPDLKGYTKTSEYPSLHLRNSQIDLMKTIFFRGS